ncbi:MAG: CHAT domain-containing protein [Holophagae bacterium]|jgi:hypothetical protein
MTRIVVRGGRTDPALAERRAAPEIHDGLVRATVKSAFDIDVSRAGDRDQPVIENAADDDVLELTLSDGVTMWTSVAQMADDRGTSRSRSDDRDELVVTPDPVGRDRSRGVARLAIKALRLLGVDIGRMTAEEVAEKLEARLEPGPGLYRCPAPTAIDPSPLTPDDLPTDRPLLVLLHGTASRTASSFADLERGSAPRWAELTQHYEGGVYAFEHRTLSRSPIDNACDLVRALPDGARLHMVSHSRGGMVGELLCRSQVVDAGEPYEAADRDIFTQRRRNADLEALDELNSLLLSKRPTVERFVRVACPVRGTLLAGKRLDIYLSVLTNLIGRALPGSTAFDLVSALVLAVAKQRTEPDTLPGIEAMMPTSPLVAVLNRPGVATAADLSVIAGDLDGRGFFGRLKTIATDLYYREDHDLVVNTGGMYGGARRQPAARSFFDEGPDVNHFNYFANSSTANQVVRGLLRDDGQHAGFTPDAPPRAEIQRTVEWSRDAEDRPIVFVLPGIMGSHLAVGDNRIWLDPIDLIRGRLRWLEIDADDVTPDRPLGRAYGDLIRFLRLSHHVVPFDFDWRLSIRTEGDRLARALDAALDRTAQPVRLLAHSMGGLVARAMIADHPDVWRRICDRTGSRLVMLGTPNGGSFAIPRVLLGHDRMVRMLAMIDVRQSLSEVLAIVARYPGLLEMLPADRDGELFDDAWWRELEGRFGNGWVRPASDDLAAARATRALLDGQVPDRGHMVYVAGWHRQTPFKVRTDGDEIRFIATAMGDGRVPWATGLLPGVPTYYVAVDHGDLADHSPAFPGLLDLLRRGRTDQLASEPPAVSRRAPEAAVEMPSDPVTVFPDADELEAAAIGAEAGRTAQRPAAPLRTAVVHGNLSFSRHVVAVGHYHDDTIVGAEAHLDRCLDGRLDLRRRLGVYPGAIGSSQVILNDPGELLPGALVIGLGQVGGLTRSRLAESVAAAAASYALECAECAAVGGSASPKPAAISALLIGSSEAGIGVRDSVHALVEGVLRANGALEESDLGSGARIAELDIIELYLDRAVQAIHALRQLQSRSDLDLDIDIEPSVRTSPGGLRRVFVSDTTSWWRRIQVERRADDDPTLVFTDMANRARADITMVPDHRELLDGFIRSAMTEGAWDAPRASAMFELLLPNELKHSISDERDLLVMVDELAAGYPWELMHDPSSGDGRPFVVRAGMIRQFITGFGSSHPVTGSRDTALVIGDPVTAIGELPGARREARSVAQRLEAFGFAVSSVIGPDARDGLDADQHSEVVAALFAGPYRIMHIAAHGLYRFGPNRDTGIVIGRDKMLRPSHIRQLRHSPELVFLNTCHSGRIQDGGRPELAANLAEQFIRQGVRAVIAAGWPVDDGAANLFARSFYDHIFANETFGRAVERARQEVYADPTFASGNTWGAYQCYGDPDWVLDPRVVIPEHGEPEPFGAPEEMICELDNISNDSATANLQGLARLEQRLDSAVGRARPDWFERSDVLSSLGHTSGQLGRLESAVDQIQRALAIDSAAVPMRDIERLGLFLARLGIEQACGDGERVDTADATIAEGIAVLDRLVAFGATTERLRLLGSCWKRRAVVNDGRTRADHLERAEHVYGEASDLAVARTGGVDPHSLFGRLTCEALRRWRGVRLGAGHVAGLVEQAFRVADTMEEASPSYWHVTARAEGLMVLHLMDGDLHAHVDEVVNGYRAARDRGASPFQIRSIRQHLELTSVLLRDPDPAEGASDRKTRIRMRLADAIDAVRDQLEAVQGS